MRYLLLLLIPTFSLAKIAGPLYTHAEREQKEFEHLYAEVNKPPVVITGAGVPSVAPTQVGDIYVDTTNRKVYISSATLTSSSWLIIN